MRAYHSYASDKSPNYRRQCLLQPPELLTEGMLSPATDVYSFGVSERQAAGAVRVPTCTDAAVGY